MVTKKLIGLLAVLVTALSSAVAAVEGAHSADAGARNESAISPNCTIHAASQYQTRSVKPGDVVCIDGDMADSRLVITKGGTPERPVTYAGEGKAVAGVTIEANNVVVDGYTMDHPGAPGIEMTGNNITVRNNTVTNPKGGDGDGLRFFGNDLKILHNTISGTSNDNGHADCMQTFASDTPSSQHVLIEGNRCEQIDNMCLMAEGPNDGEGDGKGTTSDFTIKDNFCETLKASQTLMFEDVQNCVISGNEFAAAPAKAIGLAIHSTGAHVSGNKVSPDIGYEVGIDESSMKGYEGPAPGGAP
jgi:Right handed beta helix region